MVELCGHTLCWKRKISSLAVLVETAVEMLLFIMIVSTLYPGNKISYEYDSLRTQCHAMVPEKVNLGHLIKVPLFLTNTLLCFFI